MIRRNFVSNFIKILLLFLLWPLHRVAQSNKLRLQRTEIFKILVQVLTDSKISNDDFIIQILNSMDTKFSRKKINELLLQFQSKSSKTGIIPAVKTLYTEAIFRAICQNILLISYGDFQSMKSWSSQAKINGYLNFALWRSLKITPLGVPDRPHGWATKQSDSIS